MRPSRLERLEKEKTRRGGHGAVVRFDARAGRVVPFERDPARPGPGGCDVRGAGYRTNVVEFLARGRASREAPSPEPA